MLFGGFTCKVKLLPLPRRQQRAVSPAKEGRVLRVFDALILPIAFTVSLRLTP